MNRDDSAFLERKEQELNSQSALPRSGEMLMFKHVLDPFRSFSAFITKTDKGNFLGPEASFYKTNKGLLLILSMTEAEN